MTAEITDNTASVSRSDWFLAELLVLHTIAGSEDLLLHNNFVLIQASTREAALDAAMVRGRTYEDAFVNTDGHEVAVRFVGLRNLHKIHDELADGAELLYEELSVSSEAEALLYVNPQESLSVFRTKS